MVVIGSRNSFFVNIMVLASLHSDKAVDNITELYEIFRVYFAIEFEGFFAENLKTFFEATNQN